MIKKCFVLAFNVLILCDGLESEEYCKARTDDYRQAQCFEIPPWHHQPVELDEHLERLRRQWGDDLGPSITLRSSIQSSEISRYMDTVIGPYLDTYHQNIQNSYQHYTTRILKKVKDIVNKAGVKKKKIHEELTTLADRMNVTDLCNEERRASLTISSEHLAKIYNCAKDARRSVPKLGKYADEMITITNNHMESRRQNVTEAYKVDKKNQNMNMYLKDLSKSAVRLGYELDLSLTNARRFNEQYCEKLTSCVTRVRRSTKKSVSKQQDLLYQCMYA